MNYVRLTALVAGLALLALGGACGPEDRAVPTDADRGTANGSEVQLVPVEDSAARGEEAAPVESAGTPAGAAASAGEEDSPATPSPSSGDTPLRDWDFDLLAEPLRYGPYVITAQSEPAVQADGSAWRAQFAGWRDEDAPAGDPGGELGIQIMGVPPELSVVETYATRSVSPEGEVAYQHFQVEFRTEGRERYVAIYRFAFVTERFGAPGIGVYGTIPGRGLVLDLWQVGGHPAILERPIRGDASGTFHRLRWVSDNVETIIDFEGVPLDVVLEMALQIEGGAASGAKSTEPPTAPPALRDWDFDLLAEPLRYGPYVITAQARATLPRDSSAWRERFGDWVLEEVGGGTGGELAVRLTGLPPDFTDVTTYGTQTVSPAGEVVQQSYLMSYRSEDGQRYVEVWRLAFVAEGAGTGIGVAGTIPGSSLALELGEVDGHPSILDGPSNGNLAQISGRLRWVSDNVETIIEGQGVPKELLYDLALQIEQGGP